MKKQVKNIVIFVVVCLAFIALFTTLCTLTYKKHWNLNAFWWPVAIILFLLDLVVSLLLFNNKNKTDEVKSFWLFIILCLPYFGIFAYWCFGLKNNCEDGSHPNNALILESIFQAKESIVICAKTFFPPYDIFAALNFASNGNKKITILVSKQNKKYRQELLHHRFEKQLSRKIQIYFTDQEIADTFMIFDNKKVLVANNNFNYKNVFSNKHIPVVENVDTYKHIYDVYMQAAKLDPCEVVKRPPYKRLALAFANIFYIKL